MQLKVPSFGLPGHTLFVPRQAGTHVGGGDDGGEDGCEDVPITAKAARSTAPRWRLAEGFCICTGIRSQSWISVLKTRCAAKRASKHAPNASASKRPPAGREWTRTVPDYHASSYPKQGIGGV